MQSKLELQQFEKELEEWKRSERTPLHTFRDLEEYPRFERIQHFPSCKLPCYHFLTNSNFNGVHATYTKGDRIPQVLNTLYDLSINQSHNQAIIFDRIQLLSRYVVRQRRLPPIPEGEILADSTSLDLQSLKADLREIKSQQTGLKLALAELREAVANLVQRESSAKPIEETTARVAEELRQQILEIKRSVKDLTILARSLVPEA